MSTLARVALIFICACSRTVDTFSAVTPAFLGSASGIYQVVNNSGVPISNGTRFFALQINQQLVIVSEDTANVNFAFSGPVQLDGNGGGTAEGVVNIIATERENGAAINTTFPVDASVTLGIDAMFITGHDSPNPDVPCFASSQGCGFSVTKLCDFDPEIAGIYNVTVTAQSDNGQCAGHTSLAGARQWAVATINASTNSAIVSVTSKGLEFGALTSLDLQSRALTNELSVPLTSDSATDPSVDFEGSLALEQSEVALSATSLTRTFPDGCVQHYTATGARQQGVTFSTSCPPESGIQCSDDYSLCVPAPDGFTAAQYVLTAQSGFDVAGCPAQTCATVMEAQNLCDDIQTRSAAAGDCLLASPPEAVAVSSGTSSMGNACLELSCDTSSDCTGIDIEVVATDYCAATQTNVLSLIDGNNGGAQCVVASCENVNPACPADVSCEDYGGSGGTTLFNGEGCYSQGCDMGDTLSALDAGSKALLRSGQYVVSGVANGLPVIIPPPNPNGSGQNFGCNSPVDVDTTVFTCPVSGELNPASDACTENEASAMSQIVLYRQTGGEAPLCIGYVAANSAQVLTMSPQFQCTTGTQMCCIAGGNPPLLGCATPPGAGETQMTVFVSGSTSGTVTVSAAGFTDFNGSPANDANNVTCPIGGSCTMPDRALVGGYGLTLTGTVAGCSFDGPDNGVDYVSTSGTLGSDSSAIALATPLPASSLDIKVACP